MTLEDRGAQGKTRAAEPRRVLHLIKGLALGGAEQIVSSLARAGDRGSFDYQVAYVVRGLDDLVGPLEEAGVTVHCLGARSHYDLRWAARLRALLVEGRFDVLHTHLPYTTGIGRLVVRSLPAGSRPRLVHTQHNIWQRTSTVARALGRLTWRLDDADVAVSEAARAALPAALRRRTEVVVHGIWTDHISSAPGLRDKVRAEFDVPDDAVLVVTVANLRQEKGYEVLLAAARELVDDRLPVRFVAVGHGPLEESVRASHGRLGLGEDFKLVGLRRDAVRILAGSDLFVLASHHEGFPLAVMEALAVGVPVVATAVGDVPAAVREGIDGLVVPPGDPAALAAALRTLIVDPKRRAAMTVAAREGAARFDIRSASRRLEAIYRDLTRHG
ncbi:MAG: glycosyltransferase [Acidimicrobiales bacterium]